MKHIVPEFSTATASKTKPVYVKQARFALDPSLDGSILLSTLEGEQRLNFDNVICRGVTGEFWQQPLTKLTQKYTEDVSVAPLNGWVRFNPKPDNEVYFIEVVADPTNNTDSKFSICGQWGQDDANYPGKKLQYGEVGDYICGSMTDPTDVWIVRKSIFENTYTKTP